MRVVDAIYQTVAKAGADVLAAHMGMPVSTLRKKADFKNTTHYFRPEELVALQAFAGDYSINHALAAELGGQFIEPGNFANVSDQALLSLFTSLMARNGDFAKDFQKAWDDGSLSPKEFQSLRGDLYQVKQVCAEIEARMASMVEERPKLVSMDRGRK